MAQFALSAVVPTNILDLDGLSGDFADEVTDVLASSGNVRIERIVSFGHRSPDGFWYDQKQDEWVIVLCGSAQLLIEGVAEPITLGVGDSLLLRAHQRHRVEWTLPEVKTVWLVVHFG